MASAICSGAMFSAPAKSAIVRASLQILSWARSGAELPEAIVTVLNESSKLCERFLTLPLYSDSLKYICGYYVRLTGVCK